MSRKNVVKGFQPFDAVSMAVNQTSPEINVINLDKASIFIEWNGSSPVGAIVLQAKNAADGQWLTVDLGAPVAISGNTGSHQIILNELPFYAIRLHYVATSGSGALDATVAAKTLGA